MGTPTRREYLAPRPDPDCFAGARRIPLRTPKGTFSVWIKQLGHNSTKKLCRLHLEHPRRQPVPERGRRVPHGPGCARRAR